MDTQLSPLTTRVCSQPTCRDFRYNCSDVDQLKRSEWLTWTPWLKEPDNEWPEQVNLEFASDEQTEQTASLSTTREKEPIVEMGTFLQFQPTS